MYVTHCPELDQHMGLLASKTKRDQYLGLAQNQAIIHSALFSLMEHITNWNKFTWLEGFYS